MVVHKKLAPYHPQANGQAESTNKILKTMITKIVSDAKIDRELKLHSTIWAYYVACQMTISTTPFNIVFGLDDILPMYFLLPTRRVAKKLEWIGHKLSRFKEIEHLDKTRLMAIVGMYALKW